MNQIDADAGAEVFRAVLASTLANDGEDEVRGALLLSLWPKHLTYDELSVVLTPRKQTSFFGSYWRFINELQPSFNTKEDAISGLRWLEGQADHATERTRLASRVLIDAFRLAEAEHVQDAIVSAYLAYSRNHVLMADRGDPSAVVQHYRALPWPIRRQLLFKVIRSAGPHQGRHVTWMSPWPLVEFGDLQEVVRDARLIEADLGTNKLIDILLFMVAGRTPDQATELWTLGEEIPDLQIALGHMFSIDLNSPQAKYERDAIASRKKEDGNPPTKWTETLDNVVAMSTADIQQWWRVDLALLDATLDDEQVSEFMPHLGATPRWKGLSPEYRDKLVHLARRYLQEVELTDTSWLGTETWYRPAAAGYRAIRLLAEIEPRLESLTDLTWQRWTPAIVGFSSNGSNEELAIQATIAKLCQLHAPQRFLAATQTILAGGHFPIGFDRLIAESLSDSVAEVVWNSISELATQEDRLEDHTLVRLATLLLERRHGGALELAHQQLRLSNDIGESNRRPSFGATIGAALVRYFPNEAWADLSIMQKRTPNRAKVLFSALADYTRYHEDADALHSFTEAQLVD